jgi:phage terminase large subunit-like protein
MSSAPVTHERRRRAFAYCCRSAPPKRDGPKQACAAARWWNADVDGPWPCDRRGRHFCAPRAQRAVGFIEDCCVHTKSRWARQPFKLTLWQRVEIIEPIFGWVEWSDEFEEWVRVYRVVWLSAGRKNGKSELLAAVALYLLLADGEEAAEIIGCAGTRHQAGKVFQVAAVMVQLSPRLRPALDSGRLSITQHDGARISDNATNSYYEVISADADHALGENVHGVMFDEVRTQPNDRLWNALRTSMGTRPQALMVGATTAGDEPMSFASHEEAYCRRVAADPTLDRRRYVWIMCAAPDAELNDEAAWEAANPALADFLSREALRDVCAEALLSPTKAVAFRVLHLNTWQRSQSRWLPAGRWRHTVVLETALVGHRCHGGLDLSAVSDLTSLCWYFPEQGDEHAAALWRHYVPEAALDTLNAITGGSFGEWVKGGWVTVTEGEVVDYDPLHDQIAEDYRRFAVADLGIDRWNSTGTVNWSQRHLPKLTVSLVSQTFGGQSAALKEIDRQLRRRTLDVGANPVAAWCASCAEVRQDAAENLKLVKPDRAREAARIDAVAALANAVDGFLRMPAPKPRGRVAGF